MRSVAHAFILVLTIACSLFPSDELDQQLQKALDTAQSGAALQAQKLFQGLLPKLRQSGNQKGLGRALYASSQMALSIGEYEQAIALSKESLTVHSRLGDVRMQAESWNDIAEANSFLGKYAEAIQSYEAALNLDRKSGDQLGEAIRLCNIGGMYFEQGRYAAAYRQYHAALALMNRNTDPATAAKGKQIALSNLAILYQRLGRYQQALAIYQNLGQLQLGVNERAQLQTNRGTLYRRLGDPVKAMEVYQSARSEYANRRHAPGEIAVLKNMGIALSLDLNRLPDALTAFENARKLATESVVTQVVPLHLYIAEIQKRLGKTKVAVQEFQQALDGSRKIGSAEYEWRALFGLGTLAEQQGDTTEAMKLYEQAIARVETLRGGVEIASLKRDFLADKRQVYDAAIALLLQQKELSAGRLLQLMESSRARALSDRLDSASLRSIQQQLDDRTMLLEYWQGSSQGAVLAITNRDAKVLRRQLVDAGAIRKAILNDGDWRQHAKLAGTSLLSDLPLAGISNVVIIPDGPLALLPFELLILPGADQLLTERATVFYAPSSSLLLRKSWRATQQWRMPWNPQMLAFADPEAESGLFRDARSAFPRLPKAVEEVRYLETSLPGRVEVHTGADARKQTLLAAQDRHFPMLHLATHATADYLDPEQSRILMSPDHKGEEADFLFLREIYGMDLKDYDLVVLSACDTETGKVVGGEGVEGFGKAFLTAGAQSTVTTLWRVDDAATSAFMKLFYRGLLDGQSKAEALRSAKLRFLNSGRDLQHPRYWAAFVLNGNGLTPVPRFVSVVWIGYACAALLLFAAWLFSRRVRVVS